MDPRYRKFHVLAVIAWAVITACLLWLPSHYLILPAGARYHNAGLLATVLLSIVILMGGWTGFRSICAFFHSEQ